jgi:SiaC family regulatory phosphoprotein
MEILHIKETSRTPEIILNPQKHSVEINGKFFPENIKDFLDPIVAWLGEYKKTNSKTLDVVCNIDYLSSSSVIYLKQIFLKLAEIQSNNTTVTIHWNFEEDDDDIKKTGEFYMKNLGLNFQFKVRD